MTLLEDVELLHRYTDEKSEAAFAELVRRHLTPVYAFALRQVGGDAHLAEDVAQIVFSTLARKAASLGDRQVLGGWLCRTTHFAARDVVRTERRRRAREQEAQIMQESSNDNGANIDWEKLQPMLARTVGELNDDDRDAVWLRYFEGRSFAEVGARLRLKENAARMRVERALDKLRTLLARRGVNSTTAALAVAFANQASATIPAGTAAAVTSTALADAAAGGSAATMLFNFMAATKVTVTLGFVAALAITTAVYQIGQSRNAGAALIRAGQDQAALHARLADLETRARNAEKEEANLEKALGQLRATTAGALGLAASAQADPAPPDPGKAAMLEKALRTDPQLKKVRLESLRLDALVNYRPLFKSLGWTKEQIDQFSNLTVDRFNQTLEQQNGLKKLPLNPGQSPDEKLVEELVAAVRSQFGDLAAERYAQFEKTASARALVNHVSGFLYYTDEPFTAQQTDKLTQIIAAASPLLRAGNRPVNFWELRRSVEWDGVWPQAEALLSPAQMQGLRGQAANARSELRFRAADKEAAKLAKP